MTVSIHHWPDQEVPAAVQEQISGLREQVWPSGNSPGRAFHDPRLHPRSVVLIGDDDRVLATLDILSKDLDHGGRRYAASGLSSVVTDVRLRSLGHGRRLVTAARELISRSGADLGLFTCDRPLQVFYERCGWHMLRGTSIVGGTRERPLRSDQFDKVTMASLMTRRVRANSKDFVGAEIELFPGDIDRLW